MGRVNNILYLTNLLHEKGSINVSDIRKYCKVSERTAYRYLSTMTSANIPLYFDMDTRSYRLMQTQALSTNNLSLHDIVLLMCSLSSVRQSDNMAYSEDIDRLVSLLVARYPFGLSEVWEVLKKNNPGTTGELEDFSISHIIIMVAMLLKRKIIVKVKDDHNQSISAQITLPKLVFNNNWHVTDAKNYRSNKSYCVDDIMHIDFEK